MLTEVFLVAYWTAVAGLLVYGLNCYVLTSAFLRHRAAAARHRDAVRAAHAARVDETWPHVTVQLPVFNERFVVDRLIAAAAALDYPRDKLEIQVLDDSTDDTVDIVAVAVRQVAARGLAITHVRRTQREGYKAGALRDGMTSAKGEILAIFDADFVPPTDFLRRSVPFFCDERVGLVQARWGHLNRDHSALTRAQAVAIDGHFGIEQSARNSAGWMLNFNGTAGLWRRAAIDDAGGWQADTLTEDLDLSYRSQLAGWRVEYLPDLEVPAEIPADLIAFKSQQRRWAKGSIQTARKLLGRVVMSRLPLVTKLQAVLHLTHYLVHPLMLAVALLSVPVLHAWDGHFGPTLFVVAALGLALGTAGPSTLYVTSQRALRPDPWRRLASLPMLMVVGTGVAVSNTRAVVEALCGIHSPFVRTPKLRLGEDSSQDQRPADASRSTTGYLLPVDATVLGELVMAAYCLVGLWLYLERGKWLVGPFLALYAAGFGYVGLRTLRESWRGTFTGSSQRVTRSEAAEPDAP